MRVLNVVKNLILAIILLYSSFPIIWAFLISLKPTLEITAYPPSLIFTPTLENYVKAVYHEHFFDYLKNSIIVTIGAVSLIILFALPTSYGLYRFKFRLRKALTIFILFSRMILPVTVAIPFFVIFKELNLINTYTAIILMETVVHLPMAIWLIGSYLIMIPLEVEEAAMVDGTSRFGAFLRITLPLLMSSLVPIAILSFIFIWNSLLFPLILSGPQTKTLIVAIQGYIGYEDVDWGALCATAILTALPIMILALLIQKYLIKGFTPEVMKG
jgi:multiple sugar transport system permease protein